MALDTREAWYISFSASAPFGVALLKRRMNGVIAVGAAFENDWALKPILEQIKPIVKRTPGLESDELYGLHEDTEDANALWRMAHDVIPIGWSPVYAPILEARQSVASILATQGPATSRFQIDANAPGAEILAQRIDAKQFGGMLDAVSLCCLMVEQHFPGGRRGIDSWVDKPWYEEDPRGSHENKNPLMGRE